MYKVSGTELYSCEICVDLLCMGEYLLLGNWNDSSSIKGASLTSVPGENKLGNSAYLQLFNEHTHTNTPTHSRVFTHTQAQRLVTLIAFIRLVRQPVFCSNRFQYLHLLHVFPCLYTLKVWGIIHYSPFVVVTVVSDAGLQSVREVIWSYKLMKMMTAKRKQYNSLSEPAVFVLITFRD